MSATARDEGSGENSRPLPRGGKASVKFCECYCARKTEKENFASKAAAGGKCGKGKNARGATAGGKCGNGKNSRALPRERGRGERPDRILMDFVSAAAGDKALVKVRERCRERHG